MASIEIRIAGIIALLFERDQNGQPTACVLGVVEGVPDHELTIKCNKNGTDIPIDPAVRNLQLEIAGTSANGIRFFNPGPINRITGEGDQQNASWILDFENELYGREIGVNSDRFRTEFRINNGEIFTEVRSINHLLCSSEANPHEPPTLIGFVATLVGIRTELDTANSVARLLNGANEIVTVNQGDHLEMEVFLTCPDNVDQFGLRPGHSNHYYRALGTKLIFGEKLLFSSTKLPAPQGVDPLLSGPATPEASCLVGSGGKSDPGGGH